MGSEKSAYFMIDSPCVGVCTNLFDDICKGCGRTAEEVFRWVEMTDEEKMSVILRINWQKAGACRNRQTIYGPYVDIFYKD